MLSTTSDRSASGKWNLVQFQKNRVKKFNVSTNCSVPTFIVNLRKWFTFFVRGFHSKNHPEDETKISNTTRISQSSRERETHDSHYRMLNIARDIHEHSFSLHQLPNNNSWRWNRRPLTLASSETQDGMIHLGFTCFSCFSPTTLSRNTLKYWMKMQKFTKRLKTVLKSKSTPKVIKNHMT